MDLFSSRHEAETVHTPSRDGRARRRCLNSSYPRRLTAVCTWDQLPNCNDNSCKDVRAVIRTSMRRGFSPPPHLHSCSLRTYRASLPSDFSFVPHRVPRPKLSRETPLLMLYWCVGRLHSCTDGSPNSSTHGWRWFYPALFRLRQLVIEDMIFLGWFCSWKSFCGSLLEIIF